jgi:hypothetical protein
MNNDSQHRIAYFPGYGPKLLDSQVGRVSTGMMVARRGSKDVRLACLANRCLVLAMSLIHCVHRHLGRIVCLGVAEGTGTIADRA